MMELWIWLAGLLATVACVGVIYWYAGGLKDKKDVDD